MTRLIDADAVYKEICRIYEYEYPTASGAFDEFISKTLKNIIYNAPTVDAEPVRYGKWEPDEKASDGFVIVKCPSCGHSTYVNANYVEYGSYCTYCGAYTGW